MLEKIETYILYTVIFILFIIVLPVSPNPFVVSKLIVLVYGLALALLVFAIKIFLQGKLELKIANFDLAVILIAISYILSTILRSPNKMEALLLPGTTTIVIGAMIVYFLVNQLSDKAKANLYLPLLTSGAVFSLIMFLATFKVLEKIPQLPLFMRSVIFTPSGGYLPAAIFLATIIPLALAKVIVEKLGRKKLLLLGLTFLTLAGLVLSIYQIIPGRPNSPRFPSFNTSWYIAVDTLKQSPLLGIGPGNYLTAFNRFRPLNFNLTDLWAIKFSTANNFYLTALTETGLLGATGIVLLLIASYKLIKKDFITKRKIGWGMAGSLNLLSLILILILMAIFPSTLESTVILFIVLALNAEVAKTTLNLTSQVSSQDNKSQYLTSRVPAFLISVPIAVVVIFIGYKMVNIFKAEYQFRNALTSLSNNQGVAAYDQMRSAINLNPQVDRYHASYSQVNLALANAIATQATATSTAGTDTTGQAAQISDNDRGNIAALIQQAIREAKSTVALNPLRSGNWEILARTYRAIMPLATGSDTFAIQTYSQAVALDPVNPNLRIALGGIYYAAGDFDTAVRVFELAATTKRDLANAHYNLGFALEQSGKLDQAISELSLVLSLVDTNSTDYQAAKTALENMQAKKQKEVPTGEELTPPQEAEAPILKPPLELPEESEPPESPITPTPTPTAEPEAETTPALTPTPTIIP